MTSGRAPRSRANALALGAGITCVALAGTACTSTSSSSTQPSQPSQPSPSPPTASGHTEITHDRYLMVDGLDMAIDAFVPDSAGPWPVVVAFHGRSSEFKDADSNTVIAEAAVADGALVFTPTWIAGDPFPLDVGDIVDLRHAASCAVAFSQEWATELGGDAADTVVYGFSAGAGPALAAMVAPLGDVPGCETAQSPLPVSGAVLGDGEYFYQSQPFDAAFSDDRSAMQDEVARLVDRDRWPPALDARAYVWAAESGTAPRPLADPAAPGWFADRDPDGTIESDLDGLGRLDDGIVDYVDAAQFIDLRLREAGVDSRLEVLPGGHTVDDKVNRLIDAIEAVRPGG